MQYIQPGILGPNKAEGSQGNVIFPAIFSVSQLSHVNEEICNLLNFLMIFKSYKYYNNNNTYYFYFYLIKKYLINEIN